MYYYNYIDTQFLVNDLNISVKEQLEMLGKYNDEVISLIHFRESKIMQKRIVEDNHFILKEKYDFLRNIQTLGQEERPVEEPVENEEEEESGADVSHNESESNVSAQDESLGNIIDGDESNDFVESVLMKNKVNSRAIQAAIKQYTIQKRQNAYKKIMSDIPEAKKEKETKKKKKEAVSVEHAVMSREKVNSEIEEVEKKLSHMNILKQIVIKDVDEVNNEFDKEWEFQSEVYNELWEKDILNNVEKSVYAWANENLTHWENLLSELNV